MLVFISRILLLYCAFMTVSWSLVLNPRDKRGKQLHGIYCTSQILKLNVISVEKIVTDTVYGMFWNKNVPTGIKKFKYTDFCVLTVPYL
jgi:hypothetical protein